MAWSSRHFQHPDSKYKNTADLSKKRDGKARTDSELRKDKFMDGLESWVAYWRENPHRFVIEYLQIAPFSTFQMILLYVMFKSDYFMWWASRGLGKSHLIALFCVVRCLLFPGTKVCIASGTKGQSINILSEKIKGFYDTSPMLRVEIEELKTTINDPIVRFRNGSWIKVVAASDNARSARANVLVVDEFRMVDDDIIKTVLRKFLTSRRTPAFLKNPKYIGKQEPNTEIYISSAWMKSHWSWDKFQAFVKNMVNGKKYFTCGFPYQMGVKYGIIDRQRIVDEMSEEDFDPFAFSLEMECIPFGESEKAYFKFDALNKSRETIHPIIPISDEEFVKFKDSKIKDAPYFNPAKTPFGKDKKVGEIRILSMDVALMGGKANDATSFTLIRAVPNSDEYIKFIDYIEVMDGELAPIQAKRAKQLFYDLQCDYFVMDAAGVGQGVFDDLTRITIDSIRGVEYPAWKSSVYDEKMENRYIDRDAVPVIFPIKVSGSTATQLNHEMANYTKNQFDKRKIKLLKNEVDGRGYLSSSYDFDKIDDTYRAFYMAPYYNTSRLITEMINLDMEIRNGYIKLQEPRGGRKDRASSLMYGLHFVKLLEADLKAEAETEFNLESLFAGIGGNSNRTTLFGTSTSNPFASRFNGFK